MDQQSISLMIALFAVSNIPTLFLYSRERTQSSRLRWRSYSLCFLLVCGNAFIAALVLANMVDSIAYALAHAFQLDRETSAETAKVVVQLTAAILAAFLSTLYVLRRNLLSAPLNNRPSPKRLISRTKLDLAS
jgi:hypothetical protein